MNEFEGRALVAADRLTGIVIFLIGLAAFILAIRMPTYADRGADVLTAPGIFPGAVGFMMLVSGMGLFLRSVRASSSGEPPSYPAFGAVFRTSIGFGLMVVTVLLAGRMDFYVLMAGFTLVFSAIFISWRGSAHEKRRRVIAVALVTLTAAVAVPAMFEKIFLIRLP